MRKVGVVSEGCVEGGGGPVWQEHADNRGCCAGGDRLDCPSHGSEEVCVIIGRACKE
jgi:hypothetical protein